MRPLSLGRSTDTLTPMRYWFWVFDAAVVVSFAVIGRNDHGFVSDVGDYLRVAAPFLIALGLAIIAVRAWRRPLDLRTGLALAVGTLVIGMVLRRFAWDDGTAVSFVMVAAAYVVAGMVGWRLVALAIQRLARQREPATG